MWQILAITESPAIVLQQILSELFDLIVDSFFKVAMSHKVIAVFFGLYISTSISVLIHSYEMNPLFLLFSARCTILCMHNHQTRLFC